MVSLLLQASVRKLRDSPTAVPGASHPNRFHPATGALVVLVLKIDQESSVGARVVASVVFSDRKMPERETASPEERLLDK